MLWDINWPLYEEQGRNKTSAPREHSTYRLDTPMNWERPTKCDLCDKDLNEGDQIFSLIGRIGKYPVCSTCWMPLEKDPKEFDWLRQHGNH